MDYTPMQFHDWEWERTNAHLKLGVVPVCLQPSVLYFPSWVCYRRLTSCRPPAAYMVGFLVDNWKKVRLVVSASMTGKIRKWFHQLLRMPAGDVEDVSPPSLRPLHFSSVKQGRREVVALKQLLGSHRGPLVNSWALSVPLCHHHWSPFPPLPSGL